MSTATLENAREERAKIMQELSRIRAEIKKYEPMVKPKNVKPPKVVPIGEPNEEADPNAPVSEDESNSDSLELEN